MRLRLWLRGGPGPGPALALLSGGTEECGFARDALEFDEGDAWDGLREGTLIDSG